MLDFWSVFKFSWFLLQGAGLTVVVSFLGLAVGMLLGLLLALLRLSRFAGLRFLAALYIDLFRSTPLLAQLMWIYFALPILTGLTLSPFSTGVTGLGLYSAAYVSEVYRSGILAIPMGQWSAARALGMTAPELMARVILPQAIWRVLPPLASIWISMLKESSLVSAIAMEELTFRGLSLANLTLRPVESLTLTALIYFTITYPFALLANHLHRRFSHN
jgi:polar amino acid transport system permease protein